MSSLHLVEDGGACMDERAIAAAPVTSPPAMADLTIPRKRKLSMDAHRRQHSEPNPSAAVRSCSSSDDDVPAEPGTINSTIHCPLCRLAIQHFSPSEREAHVNICLDEQLQSPASTSNPACRSDPAQSRSFPPSPSLPSFPRGSRPDVLQRDQSKITSFFGLSTPGASRAHASFPKVRPPADTRPTPSAISISPIDLDEDGLDGGEFLAEAKAKASLSMPSAAKTSSLEAQSRDDCSLDPHCLDHHEDDDRNPGRRSATSQKGRHGIAEQYSADLWSNDSRIADMPSLDRRGVEDCSLAVDDSLASGSIDLEYTAIFDNPSDGYPTKHSLEDSPEAASSGRHPRDDLAESSTTRTTRTTPAKAKRKENRKEAKPQKTPRPRKICPAFKKVIETPFTVDAFCYGKIEGCSAYFLTHFHSDHYTGLGPSFEHGPIYCSSVTGNLVISELRVKPEYVHRLKLNREYDIQGIKVTLIDANHCPGAALILFDIPTTDALDKPDRIKILHTGDFRASPEHIKHPSLRDVRLHAVYLDTTYCAPSHCFPEQSLVVRAISSLVGLVLESQCRKSCFDIIEDAKHKSTCSPTSESRGKAQSSWKSCSASMLWNWMKASGSPSTATPNLWTEARPGRLLVAVGTYLIGKERIFVGIAKAMGSKIYVEPRKHRILSCLEDPELARMLTQDKDEADLHVVSMGQMNRESLRTMLQANPSYTHLVAVRPTGWTFRGKPQPQGQQQEEPQRPGTLSLEGNSLQGSGPEPQTTPDDDTVAVGDDQGADVPFGIQHLQPQRIAHNITLFGIPYSEHSSFLELEAFITQLNGADGGRGAIHRVIPTVNNHNQTAMRQMDAWFSKWLGRS